MNLSYLITVLVLGPLLNTWAKEISGKIVSCSGCALNKLPELKAFLKGLGAEMYRNVEIEYIHGRPPTLTIYEDDVEIEKVTLTDYKTRDDLHNLFLEKGFVKKSPEEIAAVVERKYTEEQAEATQAREASMKKREEAAARRKEQGTHPEEEKKSSIHSMEL